MRVYYLLGLFLLLLALNLAGYFYIVFELDGSKVESRRSLAEPKVRVTP
ncbi:MAG: hypothetical protein KIT16_02785 [Rhodospirillaceae bacterium]|nr:hypothetical protein [Rhodospirillaceae bacterium]